MGSGAIMAGYVARTAAPVNRHGRDIAETRR